MEFSLGRIRKSVPRASERQLYWGHSELFLTVLTWQVTKADMQQEGGKKEMNIHPDAAGPSYPKNTGLCSSAHLHTSPWTLNPPGPKAKPWVRTSSADSLSAAHCCILSPHYSHCGALIFKFVLGFVSVGLTSVFNKVYERGTMSGFVTLHTQHLIWLHGRQLRNNGLMNEKSKTGSVARSSL